MRLMVDYAAVTGDSWLGGSGLLARYMKNMASPCSAATTQKACM